jgi:alkyl hydroperoxide reductase subunit D
VLGHQARWGCFVASACAVGEPETLAAIAMAAREAGFSNEAFAAAKAAAAMMAMTNVYFRAIHLMAAPEYQTLPSRLRMNRLAHPGVEAVDYELWCWLCRRSTAAARVSTVTRKSFGDAG